MTDQNFPPQGLTPSAEQIQRNLRRAQAVARRATQMGHHPLGAVLVGPDQETVLMEQCNIDTVNHAESTLARMAMTTKRMADILHWRPGGWGLTVLMTRGW